MKKKLFSILLTIISASSFGQFQWGIDFDNPWSRNDHIIIDTLSNSNNIWQIGVPSKVLFDSAYSLTHAIVTDTINSVPATDTSSFYLVHARDNSAPFHLFFLKFWYRLDGDSTDYGKIEVSPDNGLNWINMLTQDTTYDFNWINPKPSLSGTTSGWQEFFVDMKDWASGWTTFPIAMTADSIQFRFTYITDNNSSARDGWMIDDFQIEDTWSGIEEIQNDNLIAVFPNPTSEKLLIQRKESNSKQTIQVVNFAGQVIYDNKNFTGDYLDTRQLKNGIYYLKYSNTEGFSIKKFVVNH